MEMQGTADMSLGMGGLLLVTVYNAHKLVPRKNVHEAQYGWFRVSAAAREPRAEICPFWRHLDPMITLLPVRTSGRSREVDKGSWLVWS